MPPACVTVAKNDAIVTRPGSDQFYSRLDSDRIYSRHPRKNGRSWSCGWHGASVKTVDASVESGPRPARQVLPRGNVIATTKGSSPEGVAHETARIRSAPRPHRRQNRQIAANHL